MSKIDSKYIHDFKNLSLRCSCILELLKTEDESFKTKEEAIKDMDDALSEITQLWEKVKSDI